MGFFRARPELDPLTDMIAAGVLDAGVSESCLAIAIEAYRFSGGLPSRGDARIYESHMPDCTQSEAGLAVLRGLEQQTENRLKELRSRDGVI